MLAIISAMSEELEPILEAMDTYEAINYASNTYYKAKYKGVDLILAYSKIGKVFSTLTATTMIEKFGATKLLFSGVAGAVNSDLNIGDLIYATKLAQHDLDITIFGHPNGYVPEGSVYVDSDDKLNNVAKDVASDLGLKLKAGIIATGDQFIASSEKKDWIEKTFNADALEMEGASVGVVCTSLEVPFFILRAISDAADMDAGFNFDEFLDSSAKVSAEFILKMIEKID